MGMGEMQVSSLKMIKYDKNDWIMKYKVYQSKYFETIYNNLWVLTI